VQGLRTRAQFQAAMAGTVQARSPHFVLHFCKFDAAQSPQSPAPGSTVFDKGLALERPAVGALVPKRWAKRAVTRNTIKRQIYHVSLLFETQLAAGAHVVRLRSAFDPRLFPSATSAPLRAAVRQELLDLFGQLGLAASPPTP
jgi:ribonuclease P protein component